MTGEDFIQSDARPTVTEDLLRDAWLVGIEVDRIARELLADEVQQEPKDGE